MFERSFVTYTKYPGVYDISKKKRFQAILMVF